MRDQPVAVAATYTTNTRTNSHTFGGIRTRDPSNRAYADLGLRLHSQQQRQLIFYNILLILLISIHQTLDEAPEANNLNLQTPNVIYS